MQLVKDIFFLDADAELNHTTKIKGHNGEYLVVDGDVNRYEHATQIAKVFMTPTIVGEQYKYDTVLEEGDTVILHYHVIQPKNSCSLNGQLYYKCPYFQIWCVIRDEKIIPLEDYIFVEPIMESESDLFCGQFKKKIHAEFRRSTGIVYAVGKQANHDGIEVGDKVYVTSNADLEIEIMGKKLWRMRIRNVVGLECDGELVVLKDKVIVKEIEHETPESSFIITADEDKKERRGLVLKSDLADIHEGDIVSFHHSSTTAFEYNEEKYAYISAVNINYVL